MGSERAWSESCVIIGLLNSVRNIIQYPRHICDNSYEFKLESKILQKIYLQVFKAFYYFRRSINDTICYFRYFVFVVLRYYIQTLI